MEIHNLDDNKGLLSFEIGKANIITGTFRLLHIIELEKYNDNIKAIEKNLLEMNKIITENNETTSFVERTKIIKDRVFRLKELFSHIYPYIETTSKRTKRGLIDGLGTIIKSISGNMDNNDYIEISKAIETLQINQNTIYNVNKQQITMNDMMMKRFEEIHEFVNNQTILLEQELNNFGAKIVTFDRYQKLDQYLSKMEYNIEIVKEQIDVIDNIINFTKLGIISKRLLSKNEIEFIYNLFSRNGIIIKSEEDVYDLLDVQAYYNNTNIILSISIPKFHPNNFNLYKIKSIPINYTLSIEILSELILMNKEEYMYVTKPCKVIELINYCYEENLRNIKGECVTSIISGHDAKCPVHIVDFEEKLQSLAPEYLYISTKQILTLITTCSRKSKMKITGIKLINYKNCSITVNNNTFDNTFITYNQKIEYIEPSGELNISDIKFKYNLDTLNNFTLQNVDRIELLQLENNTHHQHKIIFSITIITIFLILVLYMLYKIFKFLRSKKEKISTAETSIPGPSY